MKRFRLTLPLPLTSLLAACITVNIYFPAPEVRAAAERIVEETWGGVPTEDARGSTGDGAGLLRWISPAEAVAAEEAPDINVETAAIRALKKSMKDRAAKLRPHLAAGHVGIGKDGMLVVRSLEGVPLREQAEIRRLVEAENKDRAELYREIAEANDFGSDRIDDIQEIFAETWIDKADPGWPIQKPDGSWTKK